MKEKESKRASSSMLSMLENKHLKQIGTFHTCGNNINQKKLTFAC